MNSVSVNSRSKLIRNSQKLIESVGVSLNPKMKDAKIINVRITSKKVISLTDLLIKLVVNLPMHLIILLALIVNVTQILILVSSIMKEKQYVVFNINFINKMLIEIHVVILSDHILLFRDMNKKKKIAVSQFVLLNVSNTDIVNPILLFAKPK